MIAVPVAYRLVGAAAILALASVVEAGAQAAKPERFTALALPVSAGSPTPIDILVERWSTQAEHDRLMAALAERGNKGVLETLQKLPRVGSFATTGAAGYPLRYARITTAPDGAERITLATDRDIGFWELAQRARSLDYPITLIDLRMKPGGGGEGYAAPAAKLNIDPATKTIVVENYEFQPVQIKAVRRIR